MNHCGFFGKIPSHGDFIDRGLPPEFMQAWDEWLQHGMASSRARIGGDWLNTYLTSPVWRFALSGGVCGDAGWTGIVVPSVDKVGRYFPLTIALATHPQTVPFYMVTAAADWHDAAQTLALQALQDDNLNADALASTLAQASLPGETTLVAGSAALPAGQETLLHLPLSYGSTPGHGLMAMTHRLTQQSVGERYSVWWTHGSDLVHPRLMVSQLLPPADAFGNFLTDSCVPMGMVQLEGYELTTAQAAVAAPTGLDTAVPSAATPAEEAPQLGDLLSGSAQDVEPPVQHSFDAPESSADQNALEMVEPEAVSSDEILAGFGVSEDTTQPKPLAASDKASDEANDADNPNQ